MVRKNLAAGSSSAEARDLMIAEKTAEFEAKATEIAAEIAAESKIGKYVARDKTIADKIAEVEARDKMIADQIAEFEAKAAKAAKIAAGEQTIGEKDAHGTEQTPATGQ